MSIFIYIEVHSIDGGPYRERCNFIAFHKPFPLFVSLALLSTLFLGRFPALALRKLGFHIQSFLITLWCRIVVGYRLSFLAGVHDR